MSAELGRCARRAAALKAASPHSLLALAARVASSGGRDEAALLSAAALLGDTLVKSAGAYHADPARVLAALYRGLSKPLRAVSEEEAIAEAAGRVNSRLYTEDRSWRRKTGPTVPDVEVLEDEAAPEPEGLDVDDRKRLERVLSQLNPAQRMTVEAAYGADYTETELGKLFGIGAASAAVKRDRALVRAQQIASEEE